MKLAKPPTMKEVVNFDFFDLFHELHVDDYRMETLKPIYAPYFQKCNDDDIGDYFMFFMLKHIETCYIHNIVFAMYMKEHCKQPLLGAKLLNLCFALKDDDRRTVVRLFWYDSSITLQIGNITHRIQVRMYEVPIEQTNYTKQFLYEKVIVVCSLINENQINKN